jgi:plastocyanin
VKRARTLTVCVAAALGIGVVAIPAAASSSKKKSKPVVKTVKVGDDFFAPTKLTIKEGQEIKWVWNKANLDSHNVTLISGPKGISHRKFTSATGTFGIKFERVFLKPGKYHFQCTIHPTEMNTILTVKK